MRIPKEIKYVNMKDLKEVEDYLQALFEQAIIARYNSQEVVSKILHMKNSITKTEHDILKAREIVESE